MQASIMSKMEFRFDDFANVAAGAAVLASGGGGSYADAQSILAEFRHWSGAVNLVDYDGRSNACVLAIMGSPDAAQSLTLNGIQTAINNTLQSFRQITGNTMSCAVPVEIGPINSLVPLLAAATEGNDIVCVVDGDGAGRAVPELPQTTFAASVALPVSPAVLANNQLHDVQASALYANSAAKIESLAGGVVAAFGSFSGIALWPSTAANHFALRDHYLPNTLSQAWALGRFLRQAATPPNSEAVAACIRDECGRASSVIIDKVFITSVAQSTTSASLDTGIIRFDNSPDPTESTATYYLYNLNESLILYDAAEQVPLIVAPDSICYYSEDTGRGFSNASDDLASYFNASSGRSTGKRVSIIKVEAARPWREARGVVASFAELMRKLGYGGALPYAK